MAEDVQDILLDTSVVVAHLRKQLDLFTLAATAESLLLPLVALGELYKGAEKSVQPLLARERVDRFLEDVDLLHPTIATARQYAQVAAQLERAGQKIPENDPWIAASALESGLPLATRDAHFERVPGLTILRW